MRRLVAGLLALGATVAACIVTAPPALAAGAVVSVSPGTADPDYATRLTLNGNGFQSVANGFGGVYVLFGVVEGAWKPSHGGQSGVGYTYVQDSEAAENNGYQRFVAFPGDPTAAAANGGTLAADGTWSAQLVVPGAVFQAAGRDGGVRTIDCRVSRCGVITIGAHGVVNPTNETFTPVSFAAPVAPATPVATTAAPAAPSTTAAPTTAAAPSTTPPATTSAAPSPTPTTTSATPSARTTSGSPVAATSDLDASGGTGPWPWLGGGAVLLVLLAVPAAIVLRRRRSSSEGNPS